MIPHSLTLTNFLSYRDTAELDLRGIHLACISGLNGAGKSSLLDAVTWALFGKSRSGDDDVVNRIAAGNGRAAEVAFVFELEGSLYRVMRRKALGKTTELELHLGGQDDAGEVRWRPLTESKVRETEKAIRDLLRMDYDIFTNASFLLQGQADEFTTKTPNRRKEILAEILGVSVWDERKARATDARKAAESEVLLLDRQMADIDAELAEEPERRRALEVAAAREQEVADALLKQDQLVALLRRNQALIEQQRQLVGRATADLEQARLELQQMERTAAKRRAELEGYQAILDRRVAIEAAFADWQAADAALTGWQEKAEAYAAIQKEMHPLEMAIASARSRLDQRQQELESQARQAEEARAAGVTVAAQLVARREEMERVAASAAELAARAETWQQARDRLQRLDADRRLWAQEREQLAARAATVANARQEREMIAASHEAAQGLLAEATAALEALAEQKLRIGVLQQEEAALEAERKALVEQGQRRNARIAQLEAEEGQECPLCGQELTPEHRQNALEELRGEREAQLARYRETQAQSRALAVEAESLGRAVQREKQLQRERETQQKAVAHYESQLAYIGSSIADWEGGDAQSRLESLESQLAADDDLLTLQMQVESLKTAGEQAKQVTREQQRLAGEITRLEARCEELDRVAGQWESTGRPQLEETQRTLAEEDFAPDDRAALAAVAARLAAVDYDESAHAAARARRGALVAAPDDRARLREAEAAVKPLVDGLTELEQRGASAATRVADLRGQSERLAAQLEELQSGAGDLRGAEGEMERLRLEQTTAIRAAGTARQRVDVLDDQRRQRDQLKDDRQRLAGRAGRLRQLEEACGRNGVQALLIETALPEIEDHANELLHRLSGGEMRVRFETQKERKTTGNQAETLDIKISDSTGERPYENYSGGEKFRVNFAIRLALSQVLARRAGARLRMLVIDEGFGSQDPEGRQRLVEAINEVQPEFDCILVITHIDELRDKFPARIDVEKTPTGSRLSVVAV